MRNPAIQVVATALSLSLCSCTAFNGVINGEPNFDTGILLPPDVASSLHVSFPNEFPNQMTQPSACTQAYMNPSSKYYRDICINELMSMIDIQYGEYKKSFRQVVDDSTLVADLAVIGLGSAGALVPAKTTKSILSGTAAAITGAKAAVDSDVFFNSSILVVINQMDADRQNERCVIIEQLKNDIPTANPPPLPTALTMTTTTIVSDANTNTKRLKQSTTMPNISPAPQKTYSMYDASNDLVQYYQAGTFTHALQSLQAKTGSQATKAKQQVKDQKTGTNSTSGDGAGSASVSGTGSPPGPCSS